MPRANVWGIFYSPKKEIRRQEARNKDIIDMMKRAGLTIHYIEKLNVLAHVLSVQVKKYRGRNNQRKLEFSKRRLRMRQLGLTILLLRGLYGFFLSQYYAHTSWLNTILLVVSIGLIVVNWGDKGRYIISKKELKEYEDVIRSTIAALQLVDPYLETLDFDGEGTWLAIGREYGLMFGFIDWADPYMMIVGGISMKNDEANTRWVDSPGELDERTYEIIADIDKNSESV